MLTRGRYIYRMAAFTLDGEMYEYLKPDPGHQPEDTKSWTYGNYPKVIATLPLADGGTIGVYAVAERWNPSCVLVSWAGDGDHARWAWIPAGNIRRVTDSEWDIEEFRHCPEELRAIQWSKRLPARLIAATGFGCVDALQSIEKVGSWELN